MIKYKRLSIRCEIIRDKCVLFPGLRTFSQKETEQEHSTKRRRGHTTPLTVVNSGRPLRAPKQRLEATVNRKIDAAATSADHRRAAAADPQLTGTGTENYRVWMFGGPACAAADRNGILE